MTKNGDRADMLHNALSHFTKAAERLELEQHLVEKLRHPIEQIEIGIHPSLSGSGCRHIRTFIVRHSDALGPAKGGIRMDPAVTQSDVAALAMEMTWKTSLIGVPFGGGKAGIQCSPLDLQPDHKETIIRSFTRGARRHIGPEVYIPAPDMGTDESDMAHIRDCISYSDGVSITRGCFVTGKPPILGGIPGRREATGKGVTATIQSGCKLLGISVQDARVVVQGFGNVGAVAARELGRLGARIIAVADVSGAVTDAAGIDVDRLQEHVRQHRFVKGFEGAALRGQDIFSVDCDILVPAATASQITADNADRIRARIIAEAANAPTTPEADQILAQKGVFVIPDILCNAGGVFVSYLEYTQETQREQMTREEVDTRLTDRMQERFEQVRGYSEEHRLPMREAAMDIAVGRVVDGIRTRGLLP